MKEPEIDPKLVIKTEPIMIKESGGLEYLIIIPIIILILSIIL